MATNDFFRARLNQMIDMRHPLAVPATRMPWAQVEGPLAPLLARRRRLGRTVVTANLFGTTAKLVSAGVSNTARPRLPIRLMVALLYLKHAYKNYNESVVQRWAEDVYFPFFSGPVYFEPQVPRDDSQVGSFRQVMGEAGVEQLLKTTIDAAVDMGAIKRTEFERAIVDTTVQEKAVAHTSDNRLLEDARVQIAQLATRAGIKLKQTYANEGQQLCRRAGGYAHARQFKRLRRVLRRQRTILGRMLRDVERKITDRTRDNLKIWIDPARKIQRQRPHDSNKQYALHAPWAECIAKGKARQPFEFGVKASMADPTRSGQVVGARSFPGNPCDGPTLDGNLEPTASCCKASAWSAPTSAVEWRYRSVHHLVPINCIHHRRYKTMTYQQRQWLQSRQAIDPMIGIHQTRSRNAAVLVKGKPRRCTRCCARRALNIRSMLPAIARGAIAELVLALLRLHWVVERFANSQLPDHRATGKLDTG